MQGLRIPDKSEKGLLVRIGTLIDAIVAAQRGMANAPGSVQRKANVNNLKKPAKLRGSTENIFNGASVTIIPSSTAENLSHYETQLDSDPNFSDPRTREVFTTGTTFKGLETSTTYHLRIRPVTKNGQVGEWANLESLTTTAASVAADFDGASLGASAISKSFTFNSSSVDIFCASNAGVQTFSLEGYVDVHPTPITDAESEMQIRDRRGSTVIETVTLPGVTPTTLGFPTAIDDHAQQQFRLRRYAPIIFFNLMQAATGATFPVSYSFNVQISLAGAAFTTSTYDTVWVQF